MHSIPLGIVQSPGADPSQTKDLSMKNMFRKCASICALILCLFSIAIAGDYNVEPQTHVVEKALQCEQKGVLKQKDNGYLYLEVSKDFIAETLPLIEVVGKIVPPRHYTSKKGIGAHISVMYENERIEHEIWEIAEIGQEFSFKVMELRSVKISRDNKMKKLWLLAVDAPELSRLREHYGLCPFLKGHDFHITIGTQMPKTVTEIVLFEQDEESTAA
ncbi:MAG: hypothetical protein K2P51_03060 [Rhabdochlamydiaceae bacterium]|nr:hypothetical protein [Rhabdochlamydiaceae bacterium]